MDERDKDPAPSPDAQDAKDAQDVQDGKEPEGSHPTAQQRTAYSVEDEELA